MCAQKAKYVGRFGTKNEFQDCVRLVIKFKETYGFHEIAILGERLSISDAAVGCINHVFWAWSSVNSVMLI
jgi:hypothetical protein